MITCVLICEFGQSHETAQPRPVYLVVHLQLQVMQTKVQPNQKNELLSPLSNLLDANKILISLMKRLSVTNLSSENNLLTFQLKAQVVNQ